ncbi:MAG: hypothetical protein COW18_13895 [Zetaproteobacteria bacterium CG12_big_fil_rev_8_21_14_0_65_54_13]|nr:MAG: hypothetical protein COW18_13895 [Zetaproteobacteria bacterium CG12_big_fil_rev_8_21_14_0_65_54_13]PIX55450.1 MAG: hypothetical protein COZ50_02660 [Zetaproteobacteria bacterium CG_4_10_14_3_um_filter_54_28]
MMHQLRFPPGTKDIAQQVTAMPHETTSLLSSMEVVQLSPYLAAKLIVETAKKTGDRRPPV